MQNMGINYELKFEKRIKEVDYMTFQMLENFKKSYMICFTKTDKVSPAKIEDI
jgi:GTP-binding protein EngB required for normal cell division